MGLKLSVDPTVPRIVIIAILLFVEGFGMPAYTVTTAGRFPTFIEWTSFLLSATLQVVTFVLTFLGYSKEEPTPTTPQ